MWWHFHLIATLRFPLLHLKANAIKILLAPEIQSKVADTWHWHCILVVLLQVSLQKFIQYNFIQHIRVFIHKTDELFTYACQHILISIEIHVKYVAKLIYCIDRFMHYFGTRKRVCLVSTLNTGIIYKFPDSHKRCKSNVCHLNRLSYCEIFNNNDSRKKVENKARMAVIYVNWWTLVNTLVSLCALMHRLLCI